MEKLGFQTRPQTITQKQAAAAVGQSRLMNIYENYFSRHQQTVAQILLTHDDLSHRKRFINARNTLLALLKLGIIPIINENDTVAVDEIKVGDNDNLSALITNLIEADLLIILTDIDGLCDSDPRLNPQAKCIPLIEDIDMGMEGIIGDTGGAVACRRNGNQNRSGKKGLPFWNSDDYCPWNERGNSSPDLKRKGDRNPDPPEGKKS